MKTVYVGLSGGVDSSVTTAVLQNKYRVVGVYMKNWTQDFAGLKCPWADDFADAQAVAARLQIPLEVFDFQNEYKARVVDYMIAEYLAGRTPNPDIMCNQEIKFKLFYQACMEKGADYIATGHYARIKNGKLYRGVDISKDQSYFLYRISSLVLERTLMPIGQMNKSEVRKKAAKLGLVTAAKPDSQGICFVGEVGMKTFLSKYVQAKAGNVILKSNGLVLGKHDGAIFYTIGQRHGLGIGGDGPYYVVSKDMVKNEVYVTDNADDLMLQDDHFIINDLHWITRAPKPKEKLLVRIRHLGDLIPATADIVGDIAIIKLSKVARAISPGQSAVIYAGEEILGGGIIQ